MLRKLLAAVVVLVSAAAGTVWSAAPATAATSTYKQIPGAFGALNNIYWPADSVSEVYFNVKVQDTEADGDHAEARVQSKTTSGAVTSFRWHAAYGYNTVNQFSTYIRDDTAIAAIRIQVCRKGDDLPDICDYSSWVYHEW